MNISLFASGNGSNVKNIIKHFKKNKTNKVVLIITNNKASNVINIAKNEGIFLFLIEKPLSQHPNDLLNILKRQRVDLICLAGFLRLIPKEIINVYPYAIINIHPSLLPKHGGKGMYGMKVHNAVFNNKEKLSGITIHYVNEKYDDGQIIFQKSCDISNCNSPDAIANKIQKIEHKYYSLVIESLLNKL